MSIQGHFKLEYVFCSFVFHFSFLSFSESQLSKTLLLVSDVTLDSGLLSSIENIKGYEDFQIWTEYILH